MARKREERSPSAKTVNQQQTGGACGGAGGTHHQGGGSSGGGGNNGSGSGGVGSVNSSGSGKTMAASNPVPVFASLKQQLATMGLAMREIPGDGNCLFGALADQMDGSRATHFKHRQQIVAYMRQNRLHFEPFVEDDVSFHDHLRRLSEVGTFGGNECIVAFARLHSVMVVIHQFNTALWRISGSEESGGSVGEPMVSEVHISYHNGDHYNSVRRAGDGSLAPANIRLSVLASNIGWQHKQQQQQQQQSSNNPSRADLQQLEDRLSQYTGCDDVSVVRHFLVRHQYDEGSALEALIAYLHNDGDEDADDDSDQDDTDTTAAEDADHGRHHGRVPPVLWSAEGSGCRVLGPEAAAEAVVNSAPVGPKQHRQQQQLASTAAADKLQAKIALCKVSSTKRRELKKKLRKQQNTDRKKRLELEAGDSDGLDVSAQDVILVKDITCLSI